MKKYYSADEISKELAVSVRTLRRDVSKGLPVAKTKPSPTGGKPQPFFIRDDVKNWYLENKPRSKTAKHILSKCPPKEVKKVLVNQEKKAKEQALKVQTEAEKAERDFEQKVLNNEELNGDTLLNMQARLRETEKQAFRLYMDELNKSKIGEKINHTLLDTLQKIYTSNAARRQSFEEKLPAIMEQKKLFYNTSRCSQIVARAFISLSSQLDQLGYKLADKVTGNNALANKALIDAETSELKRKTQAALREIIEAGENDTAH